MLALVGMIVGQALIRDQDQIPAAQAQVDRVQAAQARLARDRAHQQPVAVFKAQASHHRVTVTGSVM